MTEAEEVETGRGHRHPHQHPAGPDRPAGHEHAPSPDHPAGAARPGDLRRRLRDHGLRATEARVLLLDAMSRLDHPTVDALHRATAGDGIALTTVYRTLETLERAGLVWAVHVPGTGRTYHPGTHHPHAHLLCRGCGALEDLRPLPAAALAACGVPGEFAVEHVQLTVIGLHPGCRDRLAEEVGGAPA